METDYIYEETSIDDPLNDPLDPRGGGYNPAGWWEIIGGTWRWITDPTPS